MKLQLTVDGRPLEAEAGARTTLLELLRANGWTAVKEGCGIGVCGLCTVLIDDRPIGSCIYLAACADGAEVWTAAGLAEREPALAAAFINGEAMQCGICTPGQFASACALALRSPQAGEAEVREFMSGNLCRCTGYTAIVDAVREGLRARA